MRRLISTICLMAFVMGADVRADSSAEVLLEVQDIRELQGVLRLEWLRLDTGGEPEEAAALLLQPTAASMQVRLYGVVPGDYALRVHHDLDGDGEMRTNLVGMPREPWGVSNDARGRFGPPELDDMRVTIGAGEQVQVPVTLNH